ncbi:lysophospholipid acyltransferase family protein [Phycisphaerales bacterium AB-hyl4]|uniref:Lysophospholipid acyltransferase family protein n=1 Tax=Natronomicrosphaera hydrolytica TaxID=3242702 RepID=A0ABV4U2B6_9BACT
MIRGLRARQPGSPLWRIFAWYAMMSLCYVWFFCCYRFRAWGVRNIPATGPVMFVSNHQSFYDPILVGLGAHRRQFYALARASLFRNRFFAVLIRLLNAIPVEQGAGDTKAMRRCIEVLKQGHALLIFPEGARTLSGKTESFETGTMLLIKRAKPTIVPVALDGAYHVWPRSQKRPRLFGRMGVMYGEPIPADELLAMKPEEALAHLQQTVETMRQDLAGRIGTASTDE